MDSNILSLSAILGSSISGAESLYIVQGGLDKRIIASELANYVLLGNSATATKLITPRTINGQAFDGTANITIAAAASTLTGTSLASNILTSSLNTLGTLANDLLFVDNLYDIGKTGATRPRDLFTSRNITAAGNISGNAINIAGGTLGGTSAALHSTSTLTRQFLFNRSDVGISSTNGTYMGEGGAGSGFSILEQENSPLTIGTNGIQRVQISASGMLLPFLNASYDLGSTTKNWNTVYLSSPIKTISTGATPVNGQATLGAGGTVTVNTTAVTATCRIFLQRVTSGGTVGFATTITKVNGTSFTISSDNALDRSVYDWYIIESF